MPDAAHQLRLASVHLLQRQHQELLGWHQLARFRWHRQQLMDGRCQLKGTPIVRKPESPVESELVQCQDSKLEEPAPVWPQVSDAAV